MTLLDRLMFALLRPRGNPIPAGAYKAMITATYTPGGPTGSIRFKLTVYDHNHHRVGTFVADTDGASRFEIDGALVKSLVALDSLKHARERNQVQIFVEKPGVLSRLSYETTS